MENMALLKCKTRKAKAMNSTDPFETIVGEHYEALFRFALSLTRTEPDARDLTQQTFYVWARKGNQLRDRTKTRTWLFTTLYRMFLETRRRHARFPHHELDEVSQELPVCTADHADRMDSAQVLSALGRVDPIYQAAVALAYLDDCSYKNIAAILELPIGTVKSRIARGIQQLREILLTENSGGQPHGNPGTSAAAPAQTRTRQSRLPLSKNCDTPNPRMFSRTDWQITGLESHSISGTF